MTRHVILSNGSMLVCLDKNARIRDFYYPYIGQENHVSSNQHRIGVWTENKFSWIDKDNWELSIDYKGESLVSEITAYSDYLKVKLTINEAVHPKRNVFLRHINVENLSEKKREVRVFLSSHFNISEANIGDTVYFDPNTDSIIDFKGKRYFMISGTSSGKPFDQYATGVADTNNDKGTFRDAEDGILSKNPIEHGSVDSTIGFNLELYPNETKPIDYWIAAGFDHKEIFKLRKYILQETPERLIEETEKYWTEWVNRREVNFHHLNKRIQDVFKRSLLIVRAQTDNHGAIIAANDTHTFHSKKDTYSYMWPRDGALIARSLDRVGHPHVTGRFFNFCSKIASEDGYLFHKYRPDGSIGSSWHSWLKGEKVQLPIQEDETALVLDALWKHYNQHKDEGMVKGIYKRFVKKAGNFLLNFRDKKTGLPKESYDLWEEKLGVHTFTCCTTYAGLEAAKEFANVFGNKKDAEKYQKAANELREAIIKHLYDPETGLFLKGISYSADGNIIKDHTIDSSTFYGLFEYKVLNIDDPRLTETVKITTKRLMNNTGCGGLARYAEDNYYKVSKNAPENPWFISSMWLAEYYIAKAKTAEELKPAEDLLIWATERALKPETMSEQLNPYTGGPLSVAPLTWSHAGFIIATLKYLDKLEQLTRQ